MIERGRQKWSFEWSADWLSDIKIYVIGREREYTIGGEREKKRDDGKDDDKNEFWMKSWLIERLLKSIQLEERGKKNRWWKRGWQKWSFELLEEDARWKADWLSD